MSECQIGTVTPVLVVSSLKNAAIAGNVTVPEGTMNLIGVGGHIR